MAKIQKVLLLRGNRPLTSNDKGLIEKGELAIYNAADGKSTEIYATDGDENIVPFPSKEYVEDKITSMNATASGLDGRIAAIEADYLKGADKTELSGATTANTAEINAIKADYVTKAEKAELSGATTAAVERIAAIEADYLKEEDKTALNNLISANTAAIDAIEADYLKAADKTELSGLISGLGTRMDAAEDDIDALEGTVSGHTETIATLATKAELKEVADDLAELTGDGGTSVSALAARVAANETAIEKLDETYLTDAEFTEFKESNTAAINAKAATTYVDGELAKKADKDTFEGHVANTELHVTKALQDRWNTAADDIDAFLTSETGKTTAIDTLKEIQDFLSSDDGAVQVLIDKVDAAEANITTLSGNTSANATAIENEVTRAQAAEKANADAISAITADYLKGSDKTELEGKINNKADQTTVTALDGRVEAIENDYLKGSDKTELEGKINNKADQTTVDALNNVVTGHTATIATLATSATVNAIDGRLQTVEAAYITGAKQSNGNSYTVDNHVLVIDVIDCGTY